MKKNVAIFCPSGNFGGMELDSIKLSKKLNAHCNIVLLTKKGGFLEQNFDKYFSPHEYSPTLEIQLNLYSAKCQQKMRTDPKGVATPFFLKYAYSITY